MNITRNIITIQTDSGNDTCQAGRKLGRLIRRIKSSPEKCKDDAGSSFAFSFNRIAIALYGDLGAGKTTFVQGFARGLGVPEEYYITSPTYNIINEYPVSCSDNGDGLSKESFTLYHIDLYRIASQDELEYIGFDDISSSDNSVIIIEWPDIIDENIIKFDIMIQINTDKHFGRQISFIPSGLDAINLLNQFAV